MNFDAPSTQEVTQMSAVAETLGIYDDMINMARHRLPGDMAVQQNIKRQRLEYLRSVRNADACLMSALQEKQSKADEERVAMQKKLRAEDKARLQAKLEQRRKEKEKKEKAEENRLEEKRKELMMDKVWHAEDFGDSIRNHKPTAQETANIKEALERMRLRAPPL